MDGKVLEVQKTLKRYDMYDDCTSVDDVKAVVPWITYSKGNLSLGDTLLTSVMTGEDLQAMGLNAPIITADAVLQWRRNFNFFTV